MQWGNNKEMNKESPSGCAEVNMYRLVENLRTPSPLLNQMVQSRHRTGRLIDGLLLVCSADARVASGEELAQLECTE